MNIASILVNLFTVSSFLSFAAPCRDWGVSTFWKVALSLAVVERVVTGTVENILLKPSTKEAIMAWAMSLPCLLTTRPRTPTLPSSPVA